MKLRNSLVQRSLGGSFSNVTCSGSVGTAEEQASGEAGWQPASGSVRLQQGDEELGQQTASLGGKLVQHCPLGRDGAAGSSSAAGQRQILGEQPAKGKAHQDGSVKAVVLASLLHTMTASPPLTPPELKQEYDRNVNEFTTQLGELKQLMNSFRKTDPLDTEVDSCSAKLARDGGTKQVLFKLLIPNRSVFARCWKLIFFLLRCGKGQMLTGAPPPGPKIRGLTKAITG